MNFELSFERANRDTLGTLFAVALENNVIDMMFRGSYLKMGYL